MPGSCAVCEKQCSLRCGRCSQAWYCSREHQLAHWRNGHANACAAAAKRTRSAQHATQNASAATGSGDQWVRADMPSSYYDGVQALCALAATLQFENDDAARDALAQRCQQVQAAAQARGAAATQRFAHEHSLSAEQLLANRRRAAAELLQRQPALTPSNNQRAYALILEQMRSADALHDKPVGYYCGFLDASNALAHRLMQSDLAARINERNLRTTAALAVLGAGAEVARVQLQVASDAATERRRQADAQEQSNEQ